MSRYIRRPRAWEDLTWEEDHGSRTMTVHDPDPIDTGILDVDGTPIMRIPDQIGFVRH